MTDDDLDGIPPPHGTAIYAVLVEAVPPLGATPLPDASGSEGFVPGAADAVISRTTRLTPERGRRTGVPVLQALDATATGPPQTWTALHEVAASTPAIEHVDATLEALASGAHLDADQVWERGWWLATRGTAREAVKLGIAMIGLTAAGTEAEHLHVLGRHEELTLYAAHAFVRGFEDADVHLAALARDTRGWGRIHAVELLDPSTDGQVRSWLLREGFRTTVDDREIAWRVASAADLGGELERADDAPLLDGAAGLLVALCQPDHPAPGLADLADGERTVRRFLDRIAAREPTDERRRAVAAIAEFVASPAVGPANWSSAAVAEIAERTRGLLGG